MHHHTEASATSWTLQTDKSQDSDKLGETAGAVQKPGGAGEMLSFRNIKLVPKLLEHNRNNLLIKKKRRKKIYRHDMVLSSGLIFR